MVDYKTNLNEILEENQEKSNKLNIKVNNHCENNLVVAIIDNIENRTFNITSYNCTVIYSKLNT